MLFVFWVSALFTSLLIYGTTSSPNQKTVLFLDGECREQEGEIVRAERISAVRRAVQDVNYSFSHTLTAHHEFSNTSSTLKLVLEALKGDVSDIVAIVYPGCSADTTVIAEVIGIFQIPLVTYAFPNVPTSSLIFPYHFHLLPSENILSPAIAEVVERFGWKRTAILTEDVLVFKALTNQLASLWDKSSVEVIHQAVLSTSWAALDTKDLFGEDVRIFVLNMYPQLAKAVLCKAIHLLRYPGYVWITHGWYMDNWWENGSTECSEQQLKDFLNGNIGVSHYPIINQESRWSNGSAVSSPSCTHLLCDAVWAIAFALNSTGGEASRDEFRDVLENLTFSGISGPVSFKDGIRKPGFVQLIQYRQGEGGNLTRTTVTLLSPAAEPGGELNFTYQNGESLVSLWPSGIPHDGTPIEVQHYPLTALMVIVYLYATVGTGFAIVCLVFTIFFRKKKLIRLTSPNLNYLIIIGAVVMYFASLGFFYPEGSSPTQITWQCNLRTAAASLGYSICYGTINMKMWRVFYICTKAKPSMNRKPLRDWHLMLLVLLFVSVDTVILITVASLDNARYSVTIIPNKQDPGFKKNDDGIKEVSVVSRCYSPTEPYWLAPLFGYKAILQAVGVYLAFKIRKVKIRGLNDSKEVSAILYITSVILAVLVVITFALGDYIDVDGFLFSTGLCTATTVVLIFTFLPKMWGMYKDPQGQHVFEGPTSPSSTRMDREHAEGPGSNTDVVVLQNRIRELERKVEMATHTHADSHPPPPPPLPQNIGVHEEQNPK